MEAVAAPGEMDELLDRASDLAFARLDEVGGDPQALDEPLRVVVTIYSAQGVIDNGGLWSFFEGDWPAHPPYSAFSYAYRRIGANAEADAIDAAAELFGFPSPERDGVRRGDALAGSVGRRIAALDSEFGSDVWHLLGVYVRAHRGAFGEEEP